MKPMLLTTLFLLPHLLTAQDQATTLAAACDRSEVVVVATVTEATDPSPEWHRMVWRTDEVLSGQVGPRFTLMEPAGACCGRSLFALRVGQPCLLFLTRTGPTLHPFGGARGVLAPEPAILDHVRALLSRPSAAARVELLAASLRDPTPRIALDAADALAAMPELAISQADGTRVTEALAAAVQRGSTQASALLEVAVRSADDTIVDAVLPLYLRETHTDRADLLRRGLCRMPPAVVTARMPAHLRPGVPDAAAELRAAQLLRDVPGMQGQSALSSLLRRTRCPRVKLCAAEGMLASGTSAAELRTTVPAPILALAERRVAAARFRSIAPERR